jgi:hypothetical protein
MTLTIVLRRKGTILPVLVTNHTVTIAAELQNGSKIIGQCNISHPVNIAQDMASGTLEGLEDDEPTTSPQNVEFEKRSQNASQALEANIDRTVIVTCFPDNAVFIDIYRRVLHQRLRTGDLPVPKSNLFDQFIAKRVLDLLLWISLDKV